MTPRPWIEYVVPLRWEDDRDLAEFTDYLQSIRPFTDISIVDGSPDELFRRHARAWAPIVRHLPVDPWPGGNGKVAGVVTGVLAARHESVIIADDDVRYRPEQLAEVAIRLAGADVVRPQNVFRPLPWHARWDTARSLINRAFGSDYPGTLGLRRSTFTRAGGYDGDVLFENLQLIRTLVAAGGRQIRADEIFIDRRPPNLTRFLEQRVRQAYDDLAQPARLVWEASWLPLVIGLLVHRPRAVVVAVVLPIVVAELGRRRHDGRQHYPAHAALWAPLWAAERAVAVWIALLQRVTGGARYRGRRLRSAARRPAVAA